MLLKNGEKHILFCLLTIFEIEFVNTNQRSQTSKGLCHLTILRAIFQIHVRNIIALHNYKKKKFGSAGSQKECRINNALFDNKQKDL